ncbi:MAG: serine hydrolase domain-containing protein [Phycisphaerales bacterium]
MKLSCAIVVALGTSATSSDAAMPPTFDDVTALLEAALQPGGPVETPLTGAALLVERDGVILYRGAVGEQSTDDVIPLASATKWFSGAVIASTLDRGEMQLDAPLSTWLTSWDVPGKANITLRQAFSHTAGLPSNWPVLFEGGMTLQEVADAAASLPLNYAPGTMFGYGGVSMQAAAASAELAAGSDWESLFQSRIAGPLGMLDSGYTEFGAPENPQVGGGATSTLDDYGSLLRCMVRGGRAEDGSIVLTPEAVAAMLSDQSGSPEVFFSPYPGLSDYGIGVWREQESPVDGRPVLVSSAGARGTVPWIDFERGFFAVLMVDDSLQNVTPLANALRDLLDELVDPICPADRNGNRWVGIGDLLSVLASWDASVEPWRQGDATGDGFVDLDDLLVVLAAWGAC